MKMEALEVLLIYFTTNILILREYIINTNDGSLFVCELLVCFRANLITLSI